MTDMIKAAATAKRLIEANGRTVTLYQSNRTPDNPAQPWRGVSTAPAPPSGGEMATAIVAFVPPSGAGFGRSVVDQAAQLNVALSEVGLLASDSLEPGVDVERYDTLNDGADTWKIVVRDHLKPADVSIMFSLGLQKV